MAVKPSRKHKKLWYTIVTPKEFGNYTIGETLAFEPQKLVGRNIKIGMMALMNDPKKQSIRLVFRIKSVSDKTAATEIMQYEVMPSHIKRMMRKGRKKIGDSFIAELKDKSKIRIKPVIITKTKTQKSILTAIRKIAKQFIIEKAKTQNFTEMIHDTISTKFQREMRDKLKKIYPIAFCEFRMIIKL